MNVNVTEENRDPSNADRTKVGLEKAHLNFALCISMWGSIMVRPNQTTGEMTNFKVIKLFHPKDLPFLFNESKILEQKISI